MDHYSESYFRGRRLRVPSKSAWPTKSTWWGEIPKFTLEVSYPLSKCNIYLYSIIYIVYIVIWFLHPYISKPYWIFRSLSGEFKSHHHHFSAGNANMEATMSTMSAFVRLGITNRKKSIPRSPRKPARTHSVISFIISYIAKSHSAKPIEENNQHCSASTPGKLQSNHKASQDLSDTSELADVTLAHLDANEARNTAMLAARATETSEALIPLYTPCSMHHFRDIPYVLASSPVISWA